MALSETSMRVGPLMIETATIALEGELVSGDRACVSESDAGVLVSVVDGLGHGQQASNASTQACEVLRSGPSDSLGALVQRCHQKLRGTRGAVVALAFFPPPQRRWSGSPWATSKELSCAARSAPADGR